jgi:hypothetical protein
LRTIDDNSLVLVHYGVDIEAFIEINE